MSRIMVMGYELPSMAQGAQEARSYRTWQFVEPLLEEGHQVCLVVSHSKDQFDLQHPLGKALSYHRLNMQAIGWRKHFLKLKENFKPHGILAVTFNSCLRATRVFGKCPVWMDIYGDKLAEIQVAQFTQKNDRGYRTMLRYLDSVLQGGDVYSTCSTHQEYALVGQLGMVSRLNRHTLGYEFVYPILPGISVNANKPKQVLQLRDSLVPADGFIVLWCGGYNVWTDVKILFQALNQAMSRDPRIVFVSVGGGVGLAQNDSYERFLAMIKTSEFQQRFYMLGWRPVSEVPEYYHQADVGINLDAFQYETLLGTRTRLVEMMQNGLMVITSLGCELSRIIRDHKLGLTFPIGDSAAFCDHIVKMANDPITQKKLAERGQLYALQNLSNKKTTQPFLRWACQPYSSPDHVGKNANFDLHRFGYFLRFLIRGILWRVWALERGE